MCSAESVWKAKVLIKKASAHLIVNNTEALLNEIYYLCLFCERSETICSVKYRKNLKRPEKRTHMKYVIVLGDGMADEPIEALGGKTPLAYAKTPAMDRLSKKGEIGMVHTIPDGMKPGSDTANLSVLG